MKLSGQVAIVTGGGSGIGKGSALALAKEGAHVVVADINMESAEAIAAEIVGNGGKATAIDLDVASSDSCCAMVEKVVDKCGRIDVLFHAAGVQFQRTTAVDTSDEDWNRFIGVNLNGTFYVCRAVLPEMRKQESGAVVLMASGRALIGSALTTAYAAAKGGVVSFARSLAWEEGEFGISVNTINPGITDTDGARDFQKNVLGRDPAEVRAEFAAQDPLGDVSSPEDVASFVLWLATDGRWVTGQLHTLRVYTW